MKYFIDKFGDLGYMLGGEEQHCLCHKMTIGPKQVMFCGLDCAFFRLYRGDYYGTELTGVELSCASIKKDILISHVAENIYKELSPNEKNRID